MTRILINASINPIEDFGINMENKELNTASDFIEYLEKINFSKHLKKIEKKLKNKKIILYGAGSFFQTLADKYDLSSLNIIAIADRKFINHAKDETFYGYKVCEPDELVQLKPDIILLSMLKYVHIIEHLEETVLKNHTIKMKPLINKPFIEVWKEIWN